MEAKRAAEALARASSSLTTSYDAVGALAALLENCRQGLDVDAGGILVEASGQLELLASSSHAMADLEAYQLQVDEGPCVDAFEKGVSLQVHSTEALTSTWPRFADTMIAAGFESVHASPLQIQGRTFGAMGLFRREPSEFTPEEDVVARGFAHIAAMLVLQLGEVAPEQLYRRLQNALDARVLLEQAKGVLAGAHDLSMADAYDLLVQSARDRHQPLTAWAMQVIAGAQTPKEQRSRQE